MTIKKFSFITFNGVPGRVLSNAAKGYAKKRDNVYCGEGNGNCVILMKSKGERVCSACERKRGECVRERGKKMEKVRVCVR
jgi:hypothetical protein